MSRLEYRTIMDLLILAWAGSFHGIIDGAFAGPMFAGYLAAQWLMRSDGA